MSQREALDSFAGFVDRAGIRSTKTGRASETPCRKSLTINLQILHLPPKSSGNVRFCAFTAPTYPEPIRGNPDLRAGTCASGLAGVENPNSNTGLGARCNAHQRPPSRCTVLQRVAPCCTVFRPKIFSGLRCNTSRVESMVVINAVLSHWYPANCLNAAQNLSTLFSL